jgi:hypothetical protein
LCDDSTSKHTTLWQYKEKELTKYGNLMFSWKIDFELNKKCVLNLSDAKGQIVALPADADQPEVTTSGLSTPSVNPCVSVILGGSVYQPIKGTFTGGLVVEQKVDGSENGYSDANINDRKPTWSMEVYKEIPSVSSPHTDLINQTNAEVSITFGTTGKKIKLIASKCSIKSIKEGSSGNYATWTLEGPVNDDDFKIIINSDLTA